MQVALGLLEECNPNDRFKIDSIMVKGKVCQSSRTNTLAYTLCVRVCVYWVYDSPTPAQARV